MKPNKVFLIIVAVFAMFGILLSGIYFYVSKTLTPENVREIIVNGLKDSFPNARIEVGAVDFHFGTSIDFVINKIEVESELPIFSLKDARLKIPVWAILKGGGVVELDVSGPKINWHQDEKGNNWQSAMVQESSGIVKKKEGPELSLALPSFLVASRLNIKFRDTLVSYQLSEKQKGKLLVSKFLVKELGVESPAAFEIDTKLQLEQDGVGLISAKILLIGEADLHQYISQRKLSLVAVLNLTEVVAEQIKPVVIPDIRGEVKTEVNESKVVSGSLKLSFKNSLLNMGFNKEQSNMSLESVNAQLYFQDLIEASGINIKGLSANRAFLNVNGNVKISEGFLTPQLTFSLSPEVSYTYKENINSTLTFEGSLKKNQLRLNSSINLLKGNVLSEVVAEIPINESFTIEKLKTVSIKSKVSNIDVQRVDIERFIEVDEAQADPVSEKEIETASVTKAKEPKIFLLPFDFNYIIESSLLGGVPLEGQGQASLSKKAKFSSQSQLKLSKGLISYDASFTLGKSMSGGLNSSLKDVPGSAANVLIPSKLGRFEGDVDAQVKVNFKTNDKELLYDASYDVTALDGRISQIDPTAWLQSIADSFGDLNLDVSKYTSKIKIEPDFSLLNITGTATPQLIRLSRFKFVGIKDKFEITGKGHLSQALNGPSEILAEYQDHDGNLSSFLEKEVGTKILPMKLVGDHLDLKPDSAYTINKLLGVYAKTKGKKKIKKSIQKAADKILNSEDGKKVNKLLKGIFQ